MKIFHNTYEFNINSIDFLDFDLSETLFFDIETTGFAPSNTRLYLIGCLYYDREASLFRTIQWFLDDAADEKLILSSFIEIAGKYNNLVHFNGNGFDIPYITHKCRTFGLSDDLDEALLPIESIDLYKISLSLKKILKLPNLKQKTIEEFLGVSREDEFSGKELIEVYDKYMKSKDNNLLSLLLLHNLDDLKGLIKVLDIFKYSNMFNGDFTIRSVNVENISSDSRDKREVIIEAALKYKLPSRISGGNSIFYMTAFNDRIKIKISVYTNELKYFYPNYKDYYYLPEEDCSIHKSVAFYVDKNFRTQAKAANCYSKKTGQFLPQKMEIMSPYFKIEYNDKTTYFEVTDEFLKDDASIMIYSLHVLKIILNL